MASAKSKLKEYFEDHVGENIDRATLRSVAGDISDWPRALRQMRQETGYDIVPTKEGYIMKSSEPKYPPKIRGNINIAMRAQVLHRDHSTCQLCGANPRNTPGVKLVVDHVVPVDMGGETTLDNLQTLCRDCNGGKKSKFRSYKPEVSSKQRFWGLLRFIKRLFIRIIVISIIIGVLYYINERYYHLVDIEIFTPFIEGIVSIVNNIISFINGIISKIKSLFESFMQGIQ